jgi:hypothetical protein
MLRFCSSDQRANCYFFMGPVPARKLIVAFLEGSVMNSKLIVTFTGISNEIEIFVVLKQQLTIPK